MIDQSNFQSRLAEAEAALRKTFGGEPLPLDRALRRAGRRLPRRARLAGARVAAARAQAGNPKLMHQLDGAALDRDLDRLMAGIRGIDMADRRRGAVIGALASLAFNLLLFFALLLAFARWQGWV